MPATASVVFGKRQPKLDGGARGQRYARAAVSHSDASLPFGPCNADLDGFAARGPLHGVVDFESRWGCTGSQGGCCGAAVGSGAVSSSRIPTAVSGLRNTTSVATRSDLIMNGEYAFLNHSFAHTTLRSVNERTYEQDSKRVISYARVSTGAQAATGLSIDAQHRAVAEASAARGWRVVERVTDEAASGSLPADERPGLRAVLAQLEQGRADVLMATRVDRLARDTLITLQLFDRAERLGWELITLDAPEGTKTHDGRLLVGVLAVIAAHEAGSARARTIAALQTARRNGTRLGRPSRQSEDARVLATQLRAEGCSFREIAAALEVAGIVTATGKTTWHHSSVSALLSNDGTES